MTQRRLAAIMFTDIVGYTALMGSDEDKAFEVLRKNRNIQQSLIDKYHGEWLKEMGDGILAQFRSASDSVQCAIEIQQQVRKELEAKIRIGIHLGDITFENNDVFGDGVNIASRLQSICDPGGVYISESVHNAIRSQKDIQSQYLGEVKLKNVNYPFKTYYIKAKGLTVPSKQRIDELTGTKKTESVLVLPFDNYTGSEELEYFVAGMHASLIGAIGKVSGMRVISKTTANAFRNTEKSIPEIASELGVDKVIEASVLGLGEKISLQVKLVDAYPEEKQVWMQDYMEDKNQILNLYNTVTKEISNKINVFLTPEEQRLLAKTRTVNREAYDAYLKGLHFLEDFSAESLNKAMDFLNSAIDKDPDWAMLYASRAKVWMGLQQMGQESPTIAGPQLFENLNKALELDPDLAEAYFMKAMIAYLAEWDWDKSEKEFVRSLALNPSDALGRIYYAQLLVILNRPQEARAQGELAMDIDPLNPLAQVIYSALLVMLRDCKRAMQQVEKLLKDDPGNFIANNALFHAAYPCKDYDKTFKTLRNLLPHSYPLRDEVWNEIDEIYDLQGFVPAFKEITRYLEIYSNNNTVAAFEMVYLNIFADKPEKAMDWLEKSYMEHDPNMPYIATPMYSLDSLFGNPRFIEIVEKMNLLLPEKK